MYKVLLFSVFLFFQQFFQAQIKGVVVANDNLPISFVNIYIENTFVGTTTNVKGEFELISDQLTNNSQIIFQSLGFKTKKISYAQLKTLKPLQITLDDDQYQLTEVVVSAKENPADRVIREAIKNRKINVEKIKRYEADFYSKGMFKLKNMPKKILGQDIGDFEGKLDSTGSGIVYLSETFSKIKFERPNNLNETILASKVAGSDRGYSYNTARSSNIDFYDNIVDLTRAKTISPIADQAFLYYKFQLEATFYDINNKLINKIKLIPRRDVEPVYDGHIYIVEDDWTIYATDMRINGYRMQNEFLEYFDIKQNYAYNASQNIWSKNQQQLSFKAGAFGISFEGGFTHVLSNYEFKQQFEKKTFTREVVKFALDADKTTDDYWSKNRPLPLTLEETSDYIKKDSIKTLRESKTYLDSIDRKKNKPKIYDLLMGYTFKNSYKQWEISYDGLLKLVQFNTVQGWNIGTSLSYTKSDKEKRTYKNLKAEVNYGFGDKTFRPSFTYEQKFNNFNKAFLSVFTGIKAEQFNPAAITPLINTTATLFFKDNYMKLYEKRFAGAYYSQEITNGFYLAGRAEFSERLPLFNTTDYAVTKKQQAYTSNNPLDPNNATSAAIDKHHLTIVSIRPSFRFNQRYISRPDGKLNYQSGDIPELNLNYTKGFGGSDKKYNFDYIEATSFFETTLSNKGTFGTRIKAGHFIGAEGISFVDYKHFNGNQTHVYSGFTSYNNFHLLPYYAMSTNQSFVEWHVEHNFNGYIMNKIPLLNKLKTELIVGYNHLTVKNLPTYHEFSVGLNRLGFGKYKLLRIDYVKSFQGGRTEDGVMFGFMLFAL
jgi:hypothetical protein